MAVMAVHQRVAFALRDQPAVHRKRGGARQFYFKYCSTFDSTDAGNIGPVADALLAAAGGSVKRAIVMARRGVDATAADALLSAADGFLATVIDG